MLTFETGKQEYDNDAEKLVSQLVFNPEDEEAEIGE